MHDLHISKLLLLFGRAFARHANEVITTYAVFLNAVVIFSATKGNVKKKLNNRIAFHKLRRLLKALSRECIGTTQTHHGTLNTTSIIFFTSNDLHIIVL